MGVIDRRIYTFHLVMGQKVNFIAYSPMRLKEKERNGLICQIILALHSPIK